MKPDLKRSFPISSNFAQSQSSVSIIGVLFLQVIVSMLRKYRNQLHPPISREIRDGRDVHISANLPNKKTHLRRMMQPILYE